MTDRRDGRSATLGGTYSHQHAINGAVRSPAEYDNATDVLFTPSSRTANAQRHDAAR